MKKFFMILSLVATGLTPVLAQQNSTTEKQPVMRGVTEGRDWVDLGLSVMWATVNVGADAEDKIGCYFAWAETSQKTSYVADNYLESGHSEDIILTPYDVANVTWGGEWRMPNKKELLELKNRCKWVWGKKGKSYGYTITGPSGQSIFLPAGGSYTLQQTKLGSLGQYWSGQIHAGTADVFTLIFNESKRFVQADSHRYSGYLVRPVINRPDETGMEEDVTTFHM